MNKEKLMDAVTLLDGDLIENYFKNSQELSKNEGRTIKKRFLPFAAVLCSAIILFGGIFGSRFLRERGSSHVTDLCGNPGDIVPSLSSTAHSYVDRYFGVGIPITNEYGSLVCRSIDDGQMTFVLTTTKATPDIYLEFSFVSDNGFFAVRSNQPYLVTTEIRDGTAVQVLTAIPNRHLYLEVDGKECEGIPSEPGTYEITVNYSQFMAYCRKMGGEFNPHCTVSYFGKVTTAEIVLSPEDLADLQRASAE